MSNFRTKLLGLAALATAFTGVSYGQATLAGCTGAAAFVAVSGNPTLRAEGETELVSDVATTLCTNAAAAANATVYAILTSPVSSRGVSTLTGGGVSPGNSDAVLTVVGVGGGAYGPIYYPGTVSGLTASFAGVTLPLTGGAGPTTFNITISNLRVNASTGGAPQVTDTVLIQYPNAALVSTNVSYTAQNVGYIVSSLSYALTVPAAGFAVNSFTTCGGNSLPATAALYAAANPTFGLTIKQLITGAIKTQVGENGTLLANGGGGVVAASLPSNTGVAASATNLTINMANVPSGVTVYAPLTATSNGEILTLAGSPVTATSPSYLTGLAIPLVALTPSNNALSIVYQVTTVAGGAGTSFSVPIWVTALPNAAAVQGASTVAVVYGPAAALATGSLPASVPLFAVSAATPTNTFKVNSCSTTLLFPYVTNAAGFETGIAIANTTTDSLGTIAGFPSVDTPVTGTCSLNFYGNQAATTYPAAGGTPITLGAYAAATPTVVPVFANILTNMLAGTPGASGGFTGYAIASCTFTQAHGFAFIVDSQTTYNGPMGYLAVVVPNTRNEGVGTGE